MPKPSGVVFLALALLVVPGLARAQDAPKHECHVFAVDIAGELAAMKEMLSRSEADTKTYEAKLALVDLTIGRFQVAPALKAVTTESYLLPGTDLVVSASVLYTERSLPLSKYAVTLAVVLAKGPVPNAIEDTGAALAETSLEPDTFIVSARQRFLLEGKPWMVGVQCQMMTDEDRKRQIREYQEKDL